MQEPGGEELITQTIVWESDAGELETRTRVITRAEQQAQFRAREAQRQSASLGPSAAQIPSLIIDCNNQNALWLFDGGFLGGNQLCLYRNPVDSIAVADLGRILRPGLPIQSWAGAVRSLWAGMDSGNLATCDLVPARCYTAPAPYQGFDAWEKLEYIYTTPGYPTSPNTAWLDIY
ncbi:hypothetical protein [Myxococcus sp. Y35]|uniref:hypothetical protein n=1 Tax=Pseudomyxococcus flavus TaxID=3115648 RepID=UPI003CE8BC12